MPQNVPRSGIKEGSPSLGKKASSIESIVTKLLISTKQLLQTLTQWSKGIEDEKAVSDAYVQLGNDFKVVSKFFLRSGISVSDLGNVPLKLREILEVALSEPPSDSTLNKYLPRIRDIIVKLLDNLKKKQFELKLIKKNENQIGGTTQQTPVTASKDSIYKETGTHVASTPNLIKNGSSAASDLATSSKRMSIDQHVPNHSNISQNNEVPQVQEVDDTTKNVSPKQNIAVANEQLPSITVNEDNLNALSQLKSGSNLQRRASKRYSAYHMARLTTSNAATTPSTINPSPPLPVIENDKSSYVDVAGNKIQGHDNNEIAEPSISLSSAGIPDSVQTSHSNDFTIFLKHGGNVKKCTATKPTTINELRLLFVEKFTFSPENGIFPDINIKDKEFGVFYSLDEANFNDIYDGCELELCSIERPVELISRQGDKDQDFSSMLKSFRSLVEKNQEDLRQYIKLELEGINKSNSTKPENKDGAIIRKKLNPGLNQQAISKIKHDINIFRGLHMKDQQLMATTFDAIFDKIQQFKELSAKSSSTMSNMYMETSQNKLNDLSETLLTKVDDLQDIIELLRKDVADRGVRPSEKKIETVQNDITSAASDLVSMRKYIETEKPHWKKNWETLLNKVCEEQQFLALQEELARDLEEDLEKSLETFKLVKLCCEERKKNPKRSKIVPLLPIPKPGTGNMIREQLFNDVQALNPDHEGRVGALEKAEKYWQKEKTFKEGDKFENELGSYVENSNFRTTGGIDEVERLRRERDDENLKAMFGGI